MTRENKLATVLSNAGTYMVSKFRGTNTSARSLRKLYIDTLKSSLLNELYIENETRIMQTVARVLNGLEMTYEEIYNPDPGLLANIYQGRQVGGTVVLHRKDLDGSSTPMYELRNYTELAHTMIGRKRLENLQFCIEEVIKSGVPGDFIETGIWRGGATVFMRGLLAAYGISDRRVWAADSFRGVPPSTHSQDAGIDLSAKPFPVLSVGIEEVRELFRRYGLLDEQTVFLEGWFKDTLGNAPIEKLAVLRLDGDLYESTMDALNPLYPKVSSGGFIIVDDYYALPQCEQAIRDFRATHGISDPIHKIDGSSVYWMKR